METIVDSFETSGTVDIELLNVARGNENVQLDKFMLH